MAGRALRSLLRLVGTQSWIRLGVRRRIVGFFAPNGPSIGFEFDVPFHGYRYRGNTSVSQDWHVFFFGGYELKEVAFVRDLLGKQIQRATVMDVGANLGGHSLAMAGVAATVHAFEPYPPLADVIEGRIKENEIRNIELNRFGLGQQNETREYYLDTESGNTGTGSFLPEHTGAASQGEFSIRRGDDWAGALRVDFIKVDVEGYEAHVLQGMQALLARSAPVIMLEVTESSWSLLQANGGLERMVPGPADIYEIENPTYTLGVVQTRNYRLRRVGGIKPRSVSYNVVIVPESRRVAFAGLLAD